LSIFFDLTNFNQFSTNIDHFYPIRDYFSQTFSKPSTASATHFLQIFDQFWPNSFRPFRPVLNQVDYFWPSINQFTAIFKIFFPLMLTNFPLFLTFFNHFQSVFNQLLTVFTIRDHIWSIFDHFRPFFHHLTIYDDLRPFLIIFDNFQSVSTYFWPFSMIFEQLSTTSN
jgi:hypothetical protein